MMMITNLISNQPKTMKTMKHNSFFALGLIGLMTLAITGCNGFEEQKLPEPSAKGDFVIMVSPETKTQMAGSTVVWSADDELNVFAATAGQANYSGNAEFTHDSGNRFTGTLNLPSSDKNDWYVLYPYNSEIKTPANSTEGAINVGCAPGGYQTQVGNDNSAHLVGPCFPLYGKATSVPAAEIPSIDTLKQALSVLKVHVTNITSEPLTVNEVSFTGTEGIVGSFYINFAGESAVFTAVKGATSNTATLKVSNGTAIPAGDTANFYLAIKPFTATSGSTLTLAVNGYEKNLELSAAASFKEGKIRTLKFETPTEFPPLIEAWEETALSAIAPDDVLVIVGTNSNGSYAMTNNNGTTDPPAAVSVETGSVTKSGSTLIGAIAESLQWNVSGNATDGYTFYPNGSTDTWLYCTNTNNGVRVGTNDNKIFTIADNGYLYNSGTSRYVGIYDSSNWRCYSTINKDNILDQTFAFYRQTSEYAAKYAIAVDPLITGGSVSTEPEGTQYESSIVKLKANPEAGNLFTSWNVYKTGDSSTEVTVENDQFVMPGYPVTVSATFGEASLTVSGTDPAKAECTDGAEVTFTVTSNVDWKAATTTNPSYVKGIYVGETQIDTAEPEVISASADAVTVTVKMNANNTDTERTATISVTPVDQDHYSGQNKDVSVTQKLYTAPKIIDILNNAWTGISGTSYSEKTGLQGSASDAVYSVQAAGDHASIQLRSNNNNSGIVTTTSGGLVKKITVKWNSTTAAARVLNVYGKNSAYESPSDLYASSTQGTLLGTFTCSDGDASIDVDDEYEYVGIRSASGALYLDEVDIEWGQAETKYAITIDGNIENGTVTASAASIAAGNTVTLTVTPDAGYQLDELTVYKTGDISTEVTVTNNTFTMPEYAVTVTASFSAVPSINVLKSSFNAPAAAGTYTETGVYELLNGALDDDVEAIGDGDVVTVVGWEDGDITYTVTANTGAAREGTILISYNNGDPEEITVNQAAAQYQLTLTAPGEGYSITAKVGNTTVATATTTNQSVNLNYGSEVTLSATAPDGYTLDAWTVNGNVIEGEQFTLNGATTVTATFKAGIPDPGTENNPYSASAAYAAASGTEVENVYVKGIVSAITTVYSSKYNNVSFTISDDGLTSSTQFTAFRTAATSEDDVLVGDCVILKGTLKLYNSKTPELLAGNTIEARLSMPTFTSGDENFVTSTSVALTVAEGATIHYTTDGTTPTIESAVYTSAINLSSTTTINAIAEKDGLVTGVASKTFTKLQSYALTWSTPSNGTLVVKQGETTITSGTMVPENATINITATPADGYTLSTLVYNDGSDHDIKSAKSFTMPAHAVSITATFEQSGGTKTYTLTLTADDIDAAGSGTSGYAKYNGDHSKNAVASGNSTYEVNFTTNQVMPNSGNIQFQANNGTLYNTNDLGTIKEISSGNNNLTVIIGSTVNPSTSSSGGGYFVIKKTSKGAASTSTITIIFEN